MIIRKVFLAIPLLVLFSTFSYSAVELNKSSENCQKIGSVSLSRNVVSPDDAKSQLDAIAEKRGASHYRINSLVPGGGNGGGLHVSVDLYRC